jgi:hypothetical protein
MVAQRIAGVLVLLSSMNIAYAVPAEPLWIQVGSYPLAGKPDGVFQFIDVHNIKEIQPGIKTAWVKYVYWFNINYYVGRLTDELPQAATNSALQKAINDAAPIENGQILAEFNCGADLWKPLDYDKWHGIPPNSIEAHEEGLVCQSR